MLSKEQSATLESLPGWKEFCEMPDDDHTLDLHGYPVWQALETATAKVKEAWERGWKEVKLIHGAPDIGHWQTAWAVGRGGIKWGLRGLLSQGEWNQYVYPRRSRRHRIGDGAMTLAITPRNGKDEGTK